MKKTAERCGRSLVSMGLVFAMMVGVLSGVIPAAQVAAETVATLEPPTVTDYSEQVVPAQGSVTLQGGTAATDIIMPIHAPQEGVLEVALTGGLTAPVEMGFYSDESCQSVAGGGVTIPENSTQTLTQKYQVLGEGIYYLRFRWSSAVPDSSGVIQIQSVAYSGKALKLNEKTQAVYSSNSSKTLYHKLIVKKTGYVTVSGNVYRESGTSLLASSLNFSLCNKRKKPLRNVSLSSLNLYSENFALKKGTYYVAVTSGERYQLSCKNTSWKDQGGRKKSKAKLIRRKSMVKGMIAMSDSSKRVDWFKIKVSKRSKIQLNAEAVCTGTSTDLKVEIIPANKHYTLLNASVLLGNSGRKLKSRTKLNAGVYYIKVTKLTKSCSGVYTLKYVK